MFRSLIPRPTRPRPLALLVGPSFVAAIAYVDPGNFATNYVAGSTLGYTLVWVVLAANIMAMFVQSLTAKLGLATGRSLPELCREHLPRPLTRFLWAQGELVAMATDIAEVIGGAIALNLLFGIPLVAGGVITGVIAMVLLSLTAAGYRPFEIVIGLLLLVIVAAVAMQVLQVGVDGPGFAAGLVPGFGDDTGVLLACGILGATVMPHVIYLHSGLTSRRNPGDAVSRNRQLRTQRTDIVVALGIAGFVNLGMLLTAAGALDGVLPDDSLEAVHAALSTYVGPFAALLFAVALLISGLAASGVGTYAGDMIMKGFLQRQIPLLLRRLITLAPALLVLLVGTDPTNALVISQVVLSIAIPFALIPLIWFTSRSSVMGRYVNRTRTTVFAAIGAGLITAINVFLLAQLASS